MKPIEQRSMSDVTVKAKTDTMPFDIDEAVRRLRRAVQPFPPAAMFALADDGFGSPFEQLIACIISIRTYDEVSLPAAKRLFALARTPAQMPTQRRANR